MNHRETLSQRGIFYRDPRRNVKSIQQEEKKKKNIYKNTKKIKPPFKNLDSKSQVLCKFMLYIYNRIEIHVYKNNLFLEDLLNNGKYCVYRRTISSSL